MGDLLTPETASRLLPEKKLQVKLWNLPPDGAVLLGGLVGVWNQSPAVRTLVFFAGEKTTHSPESGTKGGGIAQEGPDWLRVYTVRNGQRGLGRSSLRSNRGKTFISPVVVG